MPVPRLPRAVQSVRQRDTFVPPTDGGKPAGRLPFARSLFDSVASVPAAYGMKIALTSYGKVRLRPEKSSLREATVKKIDRMREKVTILPTSVYLSKMHDAGWSLVALEWEREVESSAIPEEPEVPAASEEIPFGLRIASDCLHLEDDPLEMQTLKFLAEMIVQDISFNSMADALNVREYRTRDGRPWNAAGVFKLTPRLIEVAPRILSGAEWESRKKQLTHITWNS